jgi:hypothetical protein
MKKLENKLFSKFELEKSELNSIVGGNYTSADSDTNSPGGRYDIAVESCIDGESDVSVYLCGLGDTRDKPVLTQAP